MSGTPAELVISHLERGGYDPRPAGSGKWESRCPAHKGTRRNLSIAESSDGTVLMRCHHVDESGSNCPAATIMAELGLEMKDLFRPATGSYRANGKPAPPVTKSPGTNGKPKRKPRLFDSPRDAADFLAQKLGEKTGHWLYRDADGTAVLVVYRFDTPDGKEYRPVSVDPETGQWKIGDPLGQLPLYRLSELADAGRVYFHEGEKCADLARSLGLVATTTAHGAQSPHRTDLTPLAGKEVVIVPDLGAPGEGYGNALTTLLAKLHPRPAVKVLRLPGLTGDGDDIAEWLETRQDTSVDGLRTEIERLADGLPVENLEPAPDRNGQHHVGTPIGDHAAVVADDPIKPNEGPDDPHRLARLFRDENCQHADGSTLRYWQGEFQEWDRAYRPVLSEDLRARLATTIKDEFNRINVHALSLWAQGQSAEPEISEGYDTGPKKGSLKPKARKVTGALVANVALALGGYSLLPSRTSTPAWLTDNPPFPADEVLPTRNAIIHLPSLVDGRDAIRPPTPLFFCPYVLDYDFDADAPGPSEWFKFLTSLWGDDNDSINALQEWFGYLLTPDTRRQKILMLIGPKRSGKGTIARILKAMIGSENVANPTLSSLGTNFGLAPLVSKLAAVITDARLSGRADIAQVVERLLSISGEDGQTIDRKHLSALNTKLPTRFMMISNELPRLTETSGALAGRLIILKLTKSFYGKEDIDLERRIMPELPGILLWAIEGWRRLQERGQFVQPKSAVQLVEEMEDLASPAGMFVKERCDVAPDQEIPVKTLFEAWREWCKEKNREHVGDESAFGRNLRAVVPLLVTKPVKRDGIYSRNFVGVNLKSAY